MNKKLVITRINNRIISSVYEDLNMTEVNISEENTTGLHNIYLGRVENIVKNIDEIKDEKNAEFIEEIKEEIKSLQECVSRETKNGLMNKFSFLLAKTRKGSSKACQYILKEFAKEFIKGGAKLAFNYVVKNADKLPEYIQHISQLISI